MKVYIIFVLFISAVNARILKHVNKIDNFPLIEEMNLFNHLRNIHNTNITLYDAPTNSSEKCKKINGQFLKELFSEDWALSMFDSWGKIPIGMKELNFVSLGNFDECLAINSFIDSLNVTLETQYCLGNFQGMTTGNAMFDSLFGGSIGLCMPKDCTPQEIETQIDQWIILLKFLKINITLHLNVTSCQTNEPIPITTPDVIAIVILSLFALLSIASTIYDLIVPQNKQHDVLKAFSWYTNGLRILKTKENSNSIVSLHGIKFLSMCWVILSHRVIADALMIPNINRLSALTELTYWRSLYVEAGNYSVDSFFLVGGLLVSYTLLRTLKRTNKMFNPVIFYIHRYLRLTPAFAMMTLIDAGLISHFSSGPLFRNYVNSTNEVCQKAWWHNLLYISNYFITTQCIGQGWYLGVDMHLYILSPILLVAFWLKPLVGFILSGILLCIQFAVIFTLTYTYDLSAGIMEASSVDGIDIYFATHARFGPYVIGMAFGYIILVAKENKWQLKKIPLLSIWVADLALLIGLVLSNHPFFQLFDPPVSLIGRSFFNALHRSAWALALGWVVYACATGQGGFINTFLSWKGFIPFSRLSYSMYLIHADVIYILAMSIRSVSAYSEYSTIPNIVSDVMISAFFAMIFSLLFESPIINIEKIIFQAKTKSAEVMSKQNTLPAAVEK